MSKVKYLKFAVSFVLLLNIAGCATVGTRGYGGARSPSPANNYQGIIYVEMGGLSDVRPYMNRDCQGWGGVDESSILKGVPPGSVASINAVFGTYYFYSCNKNNPRVVEDSKISPPLTPLNELVKSEAIAPSLKIDSARDKCSELGFKKGTEKFGDCVLKISK
jgi:hypothetical protein